MRFPKETQGSEPKRDDTRNMSSGSIQFRQSRNPHAGDHIARKLTTRKDLAPAPSSGLSSQPSTSQEDGRARKAHTNCCITRL